MKETYQIKNYSLLARTAYNVKDVLITFIILLKQFSNLFTPQLYQYVKLLDKNERDLDISLRGGFGLYSTGQRTA